MIRGKAFVFPVYTHILNLRSFMLAGFLLLILKVSAADKQLSDINGVVTKFNSAGRQVLFTFDACESQTPSYWDEKLVDIIIKEKVNCIIFISGKFAEHNKEILKKLSMYPFIEFGNHSYSHKEHSEKLPADQLKREIFRTDSIIASVTGRPVKYFRFPAGNYDQQALNTVYATGHRVVHWSFASGDADKNIPAARLLDWLKLKTKPGGILIFHINRRGYKTAEILPEFLKWLKSAKYVTVNLPEH